MRASRVTRRDLFVAAASSVLTFFGVKTEVVSVIILAFDAFKHLS